MKLDRKTKEYILTLVNFVGGYETWQDLGIEAMLSIKLFSNYDINDIFFKNALDNYIKKLVKENKGK